MNKEPRLNGTKRQEIIDKIDILCDEYYNTITNDKELIHEDNKIIAISILYLPNKGSWVKVIS